MLKKYCLHSKEFLHKTREKIPSFLVGKDLPFCRLIKKSIN